MTAYLCSLFISTRVFFYLGVVSGRFVLNVLGFPQNNFYIWTHIYLHKHAFLYYGWGAFGSFYFSRKLEKLETPPNRVASSS